ncbi:hypothetical protein [Serratia marcescens]
MKVICYRCLTVYEQDTAPPTKTKRLKVLERACPSSGCKVYYG